jgi:hypothetical protein
MKKIIILLALIVYVFSCKIVNAQINKPIGVNLNYISDYSVEFTFTDAFKRCREWISYNADGTGPWNTNIKIPLGDHGYPIEIPYNDGVNPPQNVRTLLFWDIGSIADTGQYRLIVSGSGEVKFKFGASGTYTCPIDTYVVIDDNIAIEIIRSDVNDPISDIKLIYPKYTNNYQEKTFRDEFLEFLKDFQVLRFMDWTRTNVAVSTDWNTRSKVDYYSQALQNGVAWEYIIDLCNEANKDAWINIPHKATDDYVFELARLLKQNLNSDITIYLEFSNEVWNSMFSQHKDCAAMATAMGYTGYEWEKAWKYTAKRSADVFTIFESVFNDTSRLVKIIPSQAANSWITSQLVTFFNDPYYNPNQVSADAVAIAPYFGHDVANKIDAKGLASSVTVDDIIDSLELSLPYAYKNIDNNKIVADTHSLMLITYEGGQHLVGYHGVENNDTLTEKLIAANRHQDMQNLYCQYLDYWYKNAGGLFTHFSSHCRYTKWGSWGIKETMSDLENPKYKALQTCVFNSNSSSIPEPEISADKFFVYPNPSSTGEFTISGIKSTETVQVVDVMGRRCSFQSGDHFSETSKIRIENKGIYFIRTSEGSQMIIYR